MNKFKPTNEYSNWLKGTMGINITKTGLCEQIVNIWKDHMLSWPSDELEHLHEFFRHAEEDKIIFHRSIGWVCSCSCPSGLCNKLAARIDELHVAQKSRKSVWNPKTEPSASKRKRLFELELPKFNPKPNAHRKCYICGDNSCMFERQRRGELVFDINSGNYYVDRYLWKVANLFMMRGKERNEIPNTGPADTDCALIFKMMKYCNLFNHSSTENEEEYDDLLEVTHFLMKTYDHRLTEEALVECFDRMQAVLQQSQFQCENGRKAEGELSKLKEKTIILTELDTNELNFVRQAFSDQHKVVEQDICIKGNVAQKPYILEGVLKVNNTMFNHNSSTNVVAAGATGGASIGAVLGAVPGHHGAPGGASIGAIVGAFPGHHGATLGYLFGAIIRGVFDKVLE